MEDKHYYRRSLQLLRRDKGWVKPVLALAAAGFVPIVGGLALRGYAMEWARLTAWGVDSAPKQKGVKIGQCIKSGWRAFVATLVPLLALGLIRALFGRILGDANSSVLSFVNLILSVVGVFVSIFSLLCALHATIYQNIKAAFSYKRFWQMIQDDFSGFSKVTLIYFVLGVVLGIIAGVIATVIFISAFAGIVSQYRMWGYSDVAAQITWAEVFSFTADLMRSLATMSIPIALLLLVGNVGRVFLELIVATSLGLWMREFDVAHWGGMFDPIPRRRPTQQQAYYLPPTTR
jgi:hypothetical protein